MHFYAVINPSVWIHECFFLIISNSTTTTTTTNLTHKCLKVCNRNKTIIEKLSLLCLLSNVLYKFLKIWVHLKFLTSKKNKKKKKSPLNYDSKTHVSGWTNIFFSLYYKKTWYIWTAFTDIFSASDNSFRRTPERTSYKAHNSTGLTHNVLRTSMSCLPFVLWFL